MTQQVSPDTSKRVLPEYDLLMEIRSILELQDAYGCDLTYVNFPFKAADLQPTGSLNIRNGSYGDFIELHLVEYGMGTGNTRPTLVREWFIMLNPETAQPEPVRLRDGRSISVEPAIMLNSTPHAEGFNPTEISIGSTEFQSGQALVLPFLEKALVGLKGSRGLDMACRIHDKAGWWLSGK